MGHSEGFHLNVPAGLAEAARELEEIQVWGEANMDRVDAVVAAEPPAEAQEAAPAEELEPGTAGPGGEVIYQRIGHLTRTLHDAMRELGYHEELAGSRDNLPDARDRLAYIARLTGEAAEKVLNSVDRARNVQDEVSGRAEALQRRWSAVAVYTAGGDRATPAGAALVDETCAFFGSLGERAQATNEILTEIMMAQDFHDLTGQVIRRVVSLATELEEQLVKLLIDASPNGEHRRRAEPVVALEGPVVKPEGRADVVSDQAGVDDLLASLGF